MGELAVKDGDFMETRKISISLHENESYIRKRCENCDDILIRPMRLGEGHKADCLMVYIEVAVSNMMLDDSAIGKMINHFWEIPEEKIREFIRRNSLGIADVKSVFHGGGIWCHSFGKCSFLSGWIRQSNENFQ